MKTENGIDLSRLAVHQMVFDGMLRTFRVYVPAACRGNAGPFPLLITLHGGDHARAHLHTSWHVLAEEKGFLVLYPETFQDGLIWNAWEPFGPGDGRPDDVAFLDRLITWVEEHYPVDPSRVYLHGQSMGDMMAQHYLFVHPDRIAAGFLCSGPTKTKWWLEADGSSRFRPAGPCPVIRLHGERDCFRASGISTVESMLYKQQCHIELNNRCWLEANGWDGGVELYTDRDYNAARFVSASGCDLIAWTVKDGVHRPPAETERLAWTHFFSGHKVEGGLHLAVPPEGRVAPDINGVAAAAGADHLLVDGRVMPVEGKPAISINGRLYVAACVAAGVAELLGETLRPCPTVTEEGTEMVPLALALGQEGAECFDTVYLTRRPKRLSFDLAYTIRSLLGVQRPLTGQEAYTLEERIYRMQHTDAGFPLPSDRAEEVWQWAHMV